MSPTLLALGAGLASGALFALTASSVPGGNVLFCASLIPLFMAGLSLGLRPLLLAIAAAIGVVMLATDPRHGMEFFIILALPAYYAARKSLLFRRSEEGAREWYPLGNIALSLTLFAVGIFITVSVFSSASGMGLEAVIRQQIETMVNQMSDSVTPDVVRLIGAWIYLIPAIAAWSWIVMIFAALLLSQLLLLRMGRAIRGELGVRQAVLPPFLLVGLVMLGVLSLVAPGNIGFNVKVMFLILLFPYCLAGLALLHEASRPWPGRAPFLFFVYLLLVLFIWPAIPLAVTGIVAQMRALGRSWEERGGDSA